MQAQCQREVVELHGFIMNWMIGAVPRSAAAFARFADVLADGFALISPRGVITERRPLLRELEAAHGVHRADDFGFRIEVRDFRRGTVDACRSIDVNRLHREGCLVPGWCGSWEWTRNGKKIGSITLRTDANCLHLLYRVRICGGEWEDVEETVRMVRVPCRFGGARPYFICPGVVNGVACGRRVGKLFSPGRYFLCRHCHRLAYESQREQPCWRAQRRACKLWRRLGRNFEHDFIPRRPTLADLQQAGLLALQGSGSIRTLLRR